MDEMRVEKSKTSNPDAVGVTIIVATAIVMLTCIIACAGVAITWILNN